MCMNALLACVYVYHVHAWCLRKSKEAIRSPEPGIMQVCELPCGCRELDPLPQKPLAQPLAFVPAQALTRLPKLVSTRNWGLKPLLTGPNRLFVFLSLSNLFYFHGFNFYLFACGVQVFTFIPDDLSEFQNYTSIWRAPVGCSMDRHLNVFKVRLVFHPNLLCLMFLYFLTPLMILL